jgi:hypothetical protein
MNNLRYTFLAYTQAYKTTYILATQLWPHRNRRAQRGLELKGPAALEQLATDHAAPGLVHIVS